MGIANWNPQDINTGERLEVINPLSARARSLLARNRSKPMLKAYGVVQVLGAVEMLEGLDYHHDNVIKITTALASGKVPFTSAVDIDHEAVAYINRLGQFSFFAKSDFAKRAIPQINLLIPTISRLMLFRNKHAAHRSIDDPRGECEDEKVAHARALTSMMGSMLSPKPDAPTLKMPTSPTELEQFQRDLWKYNYKTFQTFDSALRKSINFTVEADHPTVMREAYSVVEKIILFE
jgi:hypothetical protein